MYVTGSSAGQSTNYDYATIAYDAAGDMLWVQRYNGPANGMDQARDVAVDDGGHVCVTGGDWGGAITGGDCATVMYDTLGEILWVQRFSTLSKRADEGRCVAIDKSGSVYVAGQCGAFISDGDMLTIKYVQAGGVAETRTTPVAPRPSLVAEPSVFGTKTTLRFSAAKAATARVLVFDATGRRVRTLVDGEAAARTNVVVWDGRDDAGQLVPAGEYKVTLTAGQTETTAKVIRLEQP